MVKITLPTTSFQNSVNYSCFHVFFSILLFVINALSYMQAITWNTLNAINPLHLRK